MLIIFMPFDPLLIVFWRHLLVLLYMDQISVHEMNEREENDHIWYSIWKCQISVVIATKLVGYSFPLSQALMPN
jgi:hypothetical protein